MEQIHNIKYTNYTMISEIVRLKHTYGIISLNVCVKSFNNAWFMNPPSGKI